MGAPYAALGRADATMESMTCDSASSRRGDALAAAVGDTQLWCKDAPREPLMGLVVAVRAVPCRPGVPAAGPGERNRGPRRSELAPVAPRPRDDRKGETAVMTELPMRDWALSTSHSRPWRVSAKASDVASSRHCSPFGRPDRLWLGASGSRGDMRNLNCSTLRAVTALVADAGLNTARGGSGSLGTSALIGNRHDGALAMAPGFRGEVFATQAPRPSSTSQFVSQRVGAAVAGRGSVAAECGRRTQLQTRPRTFLCLSPGLTLAVSSGRATTVASAKRLCQLAAAPAARCTIAAHHSRGHSCPESSLPPARDRPGLLHPSGRSPGSPVRSVV